MKSCAVLVDALAQSHALLLCRVVSLITESKRALAAADTELGHAEARCLSAAADTERPLHQPAFCRTATRALSKRASPLQHDLH